LNNPFVGG